MNIKKIAINLSIVLSLLIMSFPQKSFAQNAVAPDIWQSQFDELETMVNSSGKSNDEVGRLITWSMGFALFGASAVYFCSKVTVYDVDLWGAGGLYFLVRKLILDSKAASVAKNLEEKYTKKIQALGADSSNVNRIENRNNQVEYFTDVLKAQRESIELMKSQTNLLLHMTIIYYSALALLAILISVSKTPWGKALTDDDRLTCSKAVDKNNVLVKTWKYLNQAVAAFAGLQVVFGLLKKTTSITNNQIKFYAMQSSPNYKFWNSEVDYFSTNFNSINYMTEQSSEIELKFNFNPFEFILPLAYGQDEMADNGLGNDPKPEKWFNSAMEKVKNTILNPYVRLGLYALMGTYTAVTVSRNNKDIKEYEALISDSERQLEELKASSSTLSLNDESEKAKPSASPTSATASGPRHDAGLGCIKMLKDNKMEYDPTCECAKTKTCTKFEDMAKGSGNNELKQTLASLDKIYSGDSSYVTDEKKSSQLLNQAMSAADKSLNDLNQLRLSTGQKAIDFKGDMKKALQSTFPAKQLAKISMPTSKKSGSEKSSSYDDYSAGTFAFGEKGKSAEKGGIVFREDLPKDIPLNDINTRQEESLFDLLTLRYQKSAYPKMLQDK